MLIYSNDTEWDNLSEEERSAIYGEYFAISETKEALGGFFLFEADDLDAALELAARIPAARRGGAIEVRPVVER